MNIPRRTSLFEEIKLDILQKILFLPERGSYTLYLCPDDVCVKNFCQTSFLSLSLLSLQKLKTSYTHVYERFEHTVLFHWQRNRFKLSASLHSRSTDFLEYAKLVPRSSILWFFSFQILQVFSAMGEIEFICVEDKLVQKNSREIHCT